eukprot:m.31467 g.31467  ORF g.31467 m.31467 type:complete len:407 (+) comp12073_c0_seq1:81-1301(+)
MIKPSCRALLISCCLFWMNVVNGWASLRPGFATEDATKRHLNRLQSTNNSHYFKAWSAVDNIHLTRFGVGTFKGDATDAIDHNYVASLGLSLESGVINMVDTALSYRQSRSLSVIATVLNHTPRETVFITSKLGKIPPQSIPSEGQAFLTKTLGLIPQKDFIATKYMKGRMWVSLHPAALNHSLQFTREQLKLETIDAIYLHSAVKLAFSVYKTRAAVMVAFAKAIDFLEYARTQNWIRYYGITSSEDEGVNAALGSEYHIHLEELTSIAQAASARHGNPRHGLRMVMFYFSLRLHSGSSARNQQVQGQAVTAFEAMQRLDIVPIPIRLMDPDRKRTKTCENIPELASLSDFERRLYLSASAVADRGVAVIGQGTPSHVSSNLKLMQLPLLPLSEISTCLKLNLAG